MPQDPKRAKLIHRIGKPLLIALPLILALAWFWPGSTTTPKAVPHRTGFKPHATSNNTPLTPVNTQPWHQATVQHGETLSHLFQKNQLSSATLMRLLANAGIKKNSISSNRAKPSHGAPIRKAHSANLKSTHNQAKTC